MVAKGTACLECKRRKVACSYQRPCESCIRYGCIERCIDVKTRPTFKQCIGILNELFPDQDIAKFVNKSRDELLATILASRSTFEGTHQNIDSEIPPMREIITEPESESESDSDSESEFEVETSLRGYSWIEEASIADDVNGLNMGSRSCHLGTPSLSNIFCALRELGQETLPLGGDITSSPQEQSPSNDSPKALLPAPYVHSNELLIDSYFSYVHPMVPVVHEATFRSNYTAQSDNKSWLALLYSVLMWGKVASQGPKSVDDRVYYRAVRYYLGELGSGDEQYLQALILLCGHYLHFRNMPNTAMALSGAAFKIACGLGLHRRLGKKVLAKTTWLQREQRCRMWYSLYVAEVSGGFTLGRPSLYGGCGITIEEPQNIDDVSGKNANDHVTPVSVLLCRIGLSRIMERVEGLFFSTRFPKESQAQALDAELQAWFNSAPIYLREPVGTPLGIYMALRALKWEYMNVRIALFRTFLLRYALARRGRSGLLAHSQVALEKCYKLAEDAIADISNEWRPHLISCWPGVWYLFQASLIPLISLFSVDRQDPAIRERSRRQIRDTIATLELMREYRNTAQQSIEVLRALYHASERLPDSTVAQTHLESGTDEDLIPSSEDPASRIRHTLFMLLDPLNQEDWADPWI